MSVQSPFSVVYTLITSFFCVILAHFFLTFHFPHLSGLPMEVFLDWLWIFANLFAVRLAQHGSGGPSGLGGPMEMQVF